MPAPRRRPGRVDVTPARPIPLPHARARTVQHRYDEHRSPGVVRRAHEAGDPRPGRVRERPSVRRPPPDHESPSVVHLATHVAEQQHRTRGGIVYEAVARHDRDGGAAFPTPAVVGPAVVERVVADPTAASSDPADEHDSSLAGVIGESVCAPRSGLVPHHRHEMPPRSVPLPRVIRVDPRRVGTARAAEQHESAPSGVERHRFEMGGGWCACRRRHPPFELEPGRCNASGDGECREHRERAERPRETCQHPPSLPEACPLPLLTWDQSTP